MRLLPRYPWMLLLALVLASLMWYGTAYQRRERISEKQLEASLTLVNVPQDLVITSDVPPSLSLRVRGALSRLRSLESSQTGVVLDLSRASEGDLDLPVLAEDVIVPNGVEVVAISPLQVTLRLERIVQQRLPILPRVTGQPAAGSEVGAVSVQPPTALVSGPRQQLGALPGVVTDPVTVEGAATTVQASVAVRSPGPQVRIVQPAAARVVVEIVPANSQGSGGERR
ncbi:MAG: YbbR-like domain-containing protein [Acidobacteriota bacterium]